MRPFEWAKTILGLSCLAAALLLSSPGVRVVPALADELVSEAEPGPQCSVGRPPAADAEIEALVTKLRQEQMARSAAGEDGPVVLNGRGYNYEQAPRIELDRIQAEGAQTPRH